MTPLDIFLDDDFTGWGAAVPPPPPGDTMEVKQDIGPNANQNNIPAAGTTINDISITATKAGHIFLSAKVLFTNITSYAALAMYIKRNAAGLADTANYTCCASVFVQTTLVGFGVLTDVAIGDVFTIFVASSDGTADILANTASLITVTA